MHGLPTGLKEPTSERRMRINDRPPPESIKNLMFSAHTNTTPKFTNHFTQLTEPSPVSTAHTNQISPDGSAPRPCSTAAVMAPQRRRSVADHNWLHILEPKMKNDLFKKEIFANSENVCRHIQVPARGKCSGAIERMR